MTETTLYNFGAALSQARAAVFMVHGRGATAQSMLPLIEEIDDPSLAYLAPQAPGNAWYPFPFMSPLEQNEPYLSNALGVLADLYQRAEAAGLPAERVLLVGFSQGACLSLEYIARSARSGLPQRFGGVAGLSGGLIGPPGVPRNDSGSLGGTPVFLGCSDVDPHIPKERVLETARIFQELGAQVTTRLYPGMGHTVNEEEIDFLKKMVRDLTFRPSFD